MTESFAAGALLGHIYTLGDGLAVRLRLTRSSDAAAIRELLEDRRVDPDEIGLARLVHFDPRRRYVLCAIGLVESTVRLLGIGAIELDRAAEPELLVVRDDAPPELAALLQRALIGAAATFSRAA